MSSWGFEFAIQMSGPDPALSAELIFAFHWSFGVIAISISTLGFVLLKSATIALNASDSSGKNPHSESFTLSCIDRKIIGDWGRLGAALAPRKRSALPAPTDAPR